MASLRCHLQTFREFSGWTAPVGGFSLGPIFEARSDTLFGVLRQAIQLSASLSALDDADEENESATPSNEQQRWGNQLRALVASQRPDLAAFFNVKMRFRPDSRPIQMGFLGMGMAAHFGVIRPNRVSSAIRDAHAKLWELQQAKETCLDVYKAGLLLNIPLADDPQYSPEQMKATRTAINGLRQEAGDLLWLETATLTEEAAEVLIQRIAA
ncbi:MAG: hypothetical protein IPL59_13705 [Candidatus Competibacteraceae bacterium]|nr:hypothetical protein [Candidatus Competibacteraceae bacterium]